ncbi:hypothetical protein [Caulobacter sp.]|uniref:hypothetical protein n=1 Tax=Caulobacter sp. TaxID=78 RepID=UPI003BA9C472
MERELFDRAQRLLRHNTPPKIARLKTTAEMQLTGRVFDDRGNPMSPVISKRRGHGYRYYVSAALLTGRKHQVGSLARFPAPALEELVADRLSRLEELHDREGDLADRIRRIEVSRDTVRVDLAWDPAPALLPRFGRLLPAEDRAECDVDGLRLTIAALLQPRGGVKLALGPEGLPAVQRVKQDPTLVQALVRAEAWKHVLFTQGSDSLERLHTAEGVDRSYARRLTRLAFLSPALKRAVLEGVALPDLTLQNLMVGYLPLAWAEQEATYRLPRARAL